MDNKEVYEVSFVGQDYQPISDAARSIKIMRAGKEYIIDSNARISPKDNIESDPQKARQLIDYFLKEVAPRGYCSNSAIVVNSSQGKTKKLYDASFGPENNKGFFCGVVGVIKKHLVIKLDNENEGDLHLNVTLQIKSRLDVNSKNEISKPYFLSTMLLGDRVKLSNNTVPSSEEEIFDYLLLFWFIEQLERAHLKGYYKTYRRFENNDDKVKGVLDISRHIRLNAGQKNGRIAYTYRENTIDNYLNQLIVAAYYHLKEKYNELVVDNFDYNDELVGVINLLARETSFSKTNVKNIIKNNFKSISHPYFTEYEELRITCLRILRDEGISIFDGDVRNETQGVLFYLPDLWEQFLEKSLIKRACPKEYEVRPQYKVLNFGELFVQKTRPDYIFFDEEKIPFMILDAKCKPKWETVMKDGSLSGVMEDYNKCIRDMVAINSHATGVIFPTNLQYEYTELDEDFYHFISEYNKTDLFYTIPVTVPYVDDNDSYSKWENDFEKILQEELNIINLIIKKEAEFLKDNSEKLKTITR